MFFKIAAYDIRNGLMRSYKKYLISAAVFIVVCAAYFISLDDYAAKYDGLRSYMDILFYAFRGMEEFVYSAGTIFQFPADWMLLMVLPLYIVLYYPYNDLDSYGRQVMMLSRSRIGWWLSKCVWLIASVAVYFGLFYAVAAVFSLVMGIPINLNLSEYMIYAFDLYPEGTVDPVMVNIQFLLMPALTVITIGLLQMVLSLLIKPFYSFIISMAILLFSTYYMSPWLIGNYAMTMRSGVFSGDGVNITQGIILMCTAGAMLIIIGSAMLDRYDILNREE